MWYLTILDHVLTALNCIWVIFGQETGTFRQVIFTIYLPDGQIQFEIFKPEYLIGTVDTDGQVHQGICCYSAGYAPMCFQLFMG